MPMQILPVGRFLKDKQSGLTLLEVLMALAIVSIAMMAVIMATSQNIRSTAYLQNKMIAAWVGEQAMNQARAGLMKIDSSTPNQKLTTEMLGREWDWQIEQKDTPHPRIKKLEVKVFMNEEDKENGAPLVTLEGYVNHA